MPAVPAELSSLVPVVVVDPHLSQDFNLRKGPQPARCTAGPQSGQHFLPVPSEDLRSRNHGLRPTGHLPDLNLPSVPLVPLGFDQRLQPPRRDHGQLLQSRAQALPGQLQAAEASHRGQHIRRVGTLPPAGFQQPRLGQPREHHLQHPGRRVTFDQTSAEVAQERVVEPRVLQLQAQSVLPVDPRTHCLGRRPVRQILGELQHRDERQLPCTSRRSRTSIAGAPFGHAAQAVRTVRAGIR